MEMSGGIGMGVPTYEQLQYRHRGRERNNSPAWLRFRTHCLCILGAWLVTRLRGGADDLENYLIKSGQLVKILRFLEGEFRDMGKYIPVGKLQIVSTDFDGLMSGIKGLEPENPKNQADTLENFLKKHKKKLNQQLNRGVTWRQIAEFLATKYPDYKGQITSNKLSRLWAKINPKPKEKKEKVEVESPPKPVPAPEMIIRVPAPPVADSKPPGSTPIDLGRFR